MDNKVLENIFERKSTRKYTGTPPTQEQLEILVKAGMAAPTARNLQPWGFVLLTNEDLLQRLEDELPYAKMLTQAGAGMIVCGAPAQSMKGIEDYWVQDCSAATQNILLAAHAMELGAVWLGIYPRKDRVDGIGELLNIPKHSKSFSNINIIKWLFSHIKS